LQSATLFFRTYTITCLTTNTPLQTMDVRPIIQNDRVLVPIRFISEFFGAVVYWDDETREIVVVYVEPYTTTAVKEDEAVSSV